MSARELTEWALFDKLQAEARDGAPKTIDEQIQALLVKKAESRPEEGENERRYRVPDNRPTFWEAYAEVTGEKKRETIARHRSTPRRR